MAVTKLKRLKESSRGNRAQHLKNNVRYIMNPEKTQGGLNIGGNAGVTWQWVYDSMVENKRYWHKEDGSQAFHYVISFPPELNVSMETAHEVAQDFCDRLLGEDYLYVYAIHDDRPHLHIHVTFDSVSRTTGKKFHSPAGDWEARIQPITDEVCKKYGLPVLVFGEDRSGTSYETWEDDKKERSGATGENVVSWNDIIRDDIDEAIRKTNTYDEFLLYLKEQHYQVRDGKYLSLKPFGKMKAVRPKSLGAGYGKEEIMERVGMEKEEKPGYRVYGNPDAIRLLFMKKRYGNPTYHLSPFQRQFYRRWRNTCFIRRPGFKDAWKYKKDVLQLQEMADRIRYLMDGGITTPEECAQRRADLEKERKAAGSALNAAKTKFYRDEVCKLMRRRKTLLEKEASGEDVAAEIRSVEEAVMDIMPLGAAEEHFRKRQEAYTDCRLRIRILKKEIRLVEGIMEANREMPAYFKEQAMERNREQGIEKTVARSVGNPEENRRM